ncbi:MAG: CRISPR-associated protein Cas4, partial [Polyangiales bacterium]
RREVHFDAALRARTRRACAELHAMMAARETPPPLSADDPRCRHCSLRDGCLPERPRGELSAFWQGACDDDALS